MSDSGENTGLDLDYDDEEAFMNSFLNHVEERLNSGETDIPVNLAGIVSLPGPYIEALEAAVLAAEGAGARLWFFCTPEFSALLDQLGKSRAVPHEMIEPEVVDVPLDERRSAFELLDDWLIAREPDERDMLRQFQDNLVLMFDECAKIQLDLRKMPYLSQQLCKTLVLTAIQANEQGKPIRLKLTASQQKTLMKVPGSEFFEMPRETRRANTQQVRNLHTASQKLKRLAATAHEKSSSQSADERRECIRLRVNNAFILYKLESSSNKLKTRVVVLKNASNTRIATALNSMYSSAARSNARESSH